MNKLWNLQVFLKNTPRKHQQPSLECSLGNHWFSPIFWCTLGIHHRAAKRKKSHSADVIPGVQAVFDSTVWQNYTHSFLGNIWLLGRTWEIPRKNIRWNQNVDADRAKSNVVWNCTRGLLSQCYKLVQGEKKTIPACKHILLQMFGAHPNLDPASSHCCLICVNMCAPLTWENIVHRWNPGGI